MSGDAPNPNIEAVTKLVEALTPLTPEDRRRTIAASMILLGEPSGSPVLQSHSVPPNTESDIPGMDSKAIAWMKKHELTAEQLGHVFSIDANGVDVIVGKLLGRSKKEQTVQAYILNGIKSLIESGEPNFNDSTAREICAKVGCYDKANHALYLKKFGNLISGTKAGWKLTNPGLGEGAKIIKNLTEGHA